MNEGSIPPLLPPSEASTWAFASLCVVVAGIFVALHAQAHRQSPRVTWVVALAVAGWMALTYAFAEAGVFRSLAGSIRLGLYVAGVVLAAVLLAGSRLGARVAERASLWALVGLQAFRLPLELLLHHWYEGGTLPRQITYEGANFDLVAGALALAVALILGFGSMTGRARWRLVALFNVVGFVLLLTVMSIAIRSAPWPLRTFMNDPPVLLPLYAPYTWIVSVCVAMALWGHLVLFRWLWQQRPSAA